MNGRLNIMPKKPRPTCYNRCFKIKTKRKYSLLTTSSECYCLVHIRFPLLLEVNVIDELCMHAQLPLYSPRDWAWAGTSNRLRLKTKTSQGVCGHDWNAREVSSIIIAPYRQLCSFPHIKWIIIFFISQGLESVQRRSSGTTEEAAIYTPESKYY